MTRYTKIRRELWNVSSFTARSDNAKLEYFLISTSPQQTPLGAMRATVPGLAAELGWSLRRFRPAFDELLAAGLVEADQTASYVGIPDFFELNRPKNPNVLKSWIGALELLPDCALKVQLCSRLEALAEQLGESFAEQFRESFAKQAPKALPNQEQDQIQDQDRKVLLPESPAETILDYPLGDGDTWPLSALKVAEWRETFPYLDVLSELKRARQWLRDNPSKRKTARGMPRFLGSWLGNAEKERSKVRLPPGTDDVRSDELAEIQAKAAAGGAL